MPSFERLPLEQKKRRLHDTTLHLLEICDRLPPQEEALVKKLRERALDILDGAIFYFSIHDEPVVLKHEHLRKLIAGAHVLRALLDVVRRRYAMEEMHILMLEWEYEHLSETLQSEMHLESLHVPAPAMDAAHVRMSLPIPERVSSLVPGDSAVASGPIHPQSTPTQRAPTLHAGNGLLNERQDKIIAFMREMRKSGLKDILALFENVGEKTIRNDLNVLCANGTIQRYGTAPRSFYILTGTA